MYLQKTTGNLDPKAGAPAEQLRMTTIRSFEGGLNVADTDLNMSPKFAKILDNIERQTDGSLAVRPGTALFSNQMWDSTAITNHYYFNAFVIAVQNSGAFTKVAGDGTGTDYASFTIFNSDLIACNGKDKPILVKGNPSDPNYMAAQYLVDEATLTNVNTPVGKYVVA